MKFKFSRLFISPSKKTFRATSHQTRQTRLGCESLESRLMLHGESVVAPAEVMPDFELVDVNPTSDTLAQSISPRDYLHKVSAWYFGYAT